MSDPTNNSSDPQRLRVEAPSPASFRTKRDLVSDRVHGVARERHRAELEVAAKARPWKRHRALILVVVGVCVAFALHVFGLLLALDDPEINVQPGVRAIVASIPPSNPGSASEVGNGANNSSPELAQNAPAPVSITPESQAISRLEREIAEGGIKIITASGEEITIPVGPLGSGDSGTSIQTVETIPLSESDTNVLPTVVTASSGEGAVSPAVTSTSLTGAAVDLTPARSVESDELAVLKPVQTVPADAILVSIDDQTPIESTTESDSIETSVQPASVQVEQVDAAVVQIESLLQTAATQLGRNRLTTPAGSNAFDTYRRVLELDAANDSAAVGIEKIYGQYLTWAMNAEKSGNTRKALANYEKALKVNPGADAIKERIAQIEIEEQAEQVASIAPTEQLPGADSDSNADDTIDQQPEQAVTLTPVMLASRARLEALGLDMNEQAMIVSVDQGDFEVVKLLIDGGLSPDVTHGKYGFSPLILTAIRGDRGIMDLLLVNNANVDLRSNDGRTALMAAAWNGHADIVNQLINNGANVGLSNTDGWTAMHYAAWKGYSGIVSQLLQRGADPDHRNSDGWTVRETAERQGFIEVMETIDASSASG